MRNTKGITLIALIITIIVMLILVAVTISVALNGGIFNNAREAKTGTQKEADRETLLLAVTGTIDSTGNFNINVDNLSAQLDDSQWNVTDNGATLKCKNKSNNKEYLVNKTTGEIKAKDNTSNLTDVQKMQEYFGSGTLLDNLTDYDEDDEQYFIANAGLGINDGDITIEGMNFSYRITITYNSNDYVLDVIEYDDEDEGKTRLKIDQITGTEGTDLTNLNSYLDDKKLSLVSNYDKGDVDDSIVFADSNDPEITGIITKSVESISYIIVEYKNNQYKVNIHKNNEMELVTDSVEEM